MKRAQLAALFRRAAEIKDDPHHCFAACNAISKAVNGIPADSTECGDLDGDYVVVKEHFENGFRPKPELGDTSYGPIFWWGWPNPLEPERKEQRVLALLFAAEMALTGDL